MISKFKNNYSCLFANVCEDSYIISDNFLHLKSRKFLFSVIWLNIIRDIGDLLISAKYPHLFADSCENSQIISESVLHDEQEISNFLLIWLNFVRDIGDLSVLSQASTLICRFSREFSVN